MIKKISFAILSLMTLSTTTNAFAGTASPFTNTTTNHFNGFYLGSQIGYDDLHIHSTTTYPDLQSSSLHIFDSGRGVNLGLSLGTGTNINKFYFGVESFGNISTANAAPYGYDDAMGNSSVSGHSLVGTAGIDFIPGLILNDNAMLYARIGYGRSSINAVNESVVNHNYDVNFSENHTEATGLHTGIGVQVRLSNAIDLRAEHTHLNFGEVDDPISLSKLDPSMNTFNLALIWHVS